jgi:hypothetical protein
MNPEQENFDSLRRLMKLKRYEQPPPRYFKDFSSQVLARIEREQIKPASASWLDKFADLFHARPAFSGVLGAAVCLLLVGTAVYSESGSNQSSVIGKWPPMPESGPSGQLASTTNSLFDQIKAQPPTLADFQPGLGFSLPSPRQ